MWEDYTQLPAEKTLESLGPPPGLLGSSLVANRLPGSLTARITIGFMVLVVTFGGVSLSNVRTIERLNQWIRITHDGYLQLALVSGDLDSKQSTLRSYLREELGEENSER